ncbi:MAG: putative motility protein chaperone MotE [Candidatus Campylobacter infans]|nr:MAG: putative motility protein chaperone MotE [Candidatus Campylobacter infans]
MKNKIIILLFSILVANADDNELIYAQKREEILREYEKLELKKQELNSLNNASQKLFAQREAKLLKQEENLNKILLEITQKEQNISKMNEESEQKISKMLAKNEEILKQIKDGNKDKMLEVYTKMKDAKVASVLSQMDDKDAVRILYRLEPKKIAGIMAKLDEKKAALYTDLIKRAVMLDDNASQNNEILNNEKPSN